MARRVQRLARPGVATLRLAGEAVSLLDAWAGTACVVVIDALATGAAADTIVRVDASAAALPAAAAGTIVRADASAAALPAAAAGTIVRADASAAALPAALTPASTHAIDLADAIELGRALGLLPSRLVVIAVVGQDFTVGTGLTPAVARAVGPAAGAVVAELRG